jgi:DNA polymerase III delta prime subunit
MTKEKSMLVEKYRPKTLDDIVGHDKVVKYLRDKIEKGNIPHLMLTGKQGIGKTSIANVISYQLFGYELTGKNMNRNVLELNASDARGINVVRKDIVTFAKTKGNIIERKVPFKFCVLDEGDNMTADAQHALRRIMEYYEVNCRFIIIGNYAHKLIDPLKSRCKVYELHDISNEDMLKRLRFICESEGINIEDKTLSAICERSYGDIRIAINNFIEDFRYSDKKITLDSVMSIKDEFSKLESVLITSLKGKFLESRKKSYQLLQEGMNIKEFLKRLHYTYVNSKMFPNKMKGALSELSLHAERSIHQGCSVDIVLSSLLNQIYKVGIEFPPKSKTSSKT